MKFVKIKNRGGREVTVTEARAQEMVKRAEGTIVKTKPEPKPEPKKEPKKGKSGE